MGSVNYTVIAILVGYVILTLLVANFWVKKRMGADHYLIAGRSLPIFMVVAVVLGDWLGGGSTIGVCQRGYNEGIVGIMYPISIGIALFVFAATMAKRFRRSKAVTVPEMTGKIFDTRTKLTTAIIIGFTYYVLGITQIISGGALCSTLLGVDKVWAELIAATIFIAITMNGGLLSIAAVNLVQCVVIYLGMIVGLIFSLSFIGIDVSGGLNRLMTELPPTFWSFETIHPITWIGEVLAVVLSCFAAQAAITGVFAARNEKDAIRGTLIAGALIMPIGIIFVLIGMCAKIHYGPDLPGGLTAAPAMMLALNPIVAGTALCGLFAAIISTGPLCFLAPTQIIIQDIYKAHINPRASDRKILLLSRATTFTTIAIGWVISQTLYDVLGTILWAFALRSGITVILLIATYMGTRYISEAGAFWSLIVGFLVLIVWTLMDSPFGIHVVMPTALAIFLASLIITRLNPRGANASFLEDRISSVESDPL